MSKKTKSAFGKKDFTEKEYTGIQKQLSQPIAKEHISRRPGGGGTFDYVSAWVVIDLANRVFGFNGWSSQILSVNQDHFGQTRDGKFEVAVSACVRVTLKDGAYREGFGFGASKGMKNKFQCLESGKKKAITDATKRALKLFGNYLGNGLEIREKDFSRYEQKRKSSIVYEAGENEIKYELKKPRNNSQMPSQNLPQNFQIKQDPMFLNNSQKPQQQQQQQQQLSQQPQQNLNNNNLINGGKTGVQQKDFLLKKNALPQNNQVAQKIGGENRAIGFLTKTNNNNINLQPQNKVPFQQPHPQLQQQQTQPLPQQQQQQPRIQPPQQQQIINNSKQQSNSFVQFIKKEINTQSTINTQIKSSQPFVFHNKTNSTNKFNQQLPNNQIPQNIQINKF
ncbi:DNA repair and recombination protein rad52 [Anaeramoeba flamelloides]|uniref:DNA repair and recombination protein rad52 n=1 Tax=Anaeramoeba flamelloides TaxID=1746091 RepID=A0ABQ8YQN7_9EUKA|nr:DNA repair and recombination protein rad52 [Anaeramoeba flamelloides]